MMMMMEQPFLSSSSSNKKLLQLSAQCSSLRRDVFQLRTEVKAEFRAFSKEIFSSSMPFQLSISSTSEKRQFLATMQKKKSGEGEGGEKEESKASSPHRRSTVFSHQRTSCFRSRNASTLGKMPMAPTRTESLHSLKAPSEPAVGIMSILNQWVERKDEDEEVFQKHFFAQREKDESMVKKLHNVIMHLAKHTFSAKLFEKNASVHQSTLSDFNWKFKNISDLTDADDDDNVGSSQKLSSLLSEVVPQAIAALQILVTAVQHLHTSSDLLLLKAEELEITKSSLQKELHSHAVTMESLTEQLEHFMRNTPTTILNSSSPVVEKRVLILNTEPPLMQAALLSFQDCKVSEEKEGRMGETKEQRRPATQEGGKGNSQGRRGGRRNDPAQKAGATSSSSFAENVQRLKHAVEKAAMTQQFVTMVEENNMKKTNVNLNYPNKNDHLGVSSKFCPALQLMCGVAEEKRKKTAEEEEKVAKRKEISGEALWRHKCIHAWYKLGAMHIRYRGLCMKLVRDWQTSSALAKVLHPRVDRLPEHLCIRGTQEEVGDQHSNNAKGGGGHLINSSLLNSNSSRGPPPSIITPIPPKIFSSPSISNTLVSSMVESAGGGGKLYQRSDLQQPSNGTPQLWRRRKNESSSRSAMKKDNEEKKNHSIAPPPSRQKKTGNAHAAADALKDNKQEPSDEGAPVAFNKSQKNDDEVDKKEKQEEVDIIEKTTTSCEVKKSRPEDSFSSGANHPHSTNHMRGNPMDSVTRFKGLGSHGPTRSGPAGPHSIFSGVPTKEVIDHFLAMYPT